jgi:hypothetical protein
MKKEVILFVSVQAKFQIRYKLGKVKLTLWLSTMLRRCVGGMVIKLHSFLVLDTGWR